MAETGGPRLTRGEAVLFWTMVVASFVLVFAVAVVPDCRRSMALDQKLAEMRKANDELAARVNELKQEKQALEKDPFYVEKLARRMMSLRRPGEVVMISLANAASEHEQEVVTPNDPPASAVSEVMYHLEPFATNGVVRLFAVVLALGNMLAAFVLFGREGTGGDAGSCHL
jgi:cell division protein FtsB